METTPDSGFASRVPDTVCVDLDGTLIRTDTLLEGLLRVLHDPRNWLRLPGWILRGRAALKREVAARAPVDPAVLPYEPSLIAYLEAQRARGRRLVLVTAADRDVAERVNGHLRLFDEVIASNGAQNLKGRAKGEALAKRFGARGFTYAGNAWADLHIWRQAAAAVVVNAPRWLAARVASVAPIERRIDERPPLAWSLLRALRPHQWSKNVLVFLPILTANALRDVRAWRETAVMFVAFCATASALYIVNDLTDLAADRRHPRKRRRPFASGDLPIAIGIAAAPLLLAIGIALSMAIDAAPILVFYAVCSLAYSMRLKELPLVDVFMLAGLYSLRLFGGGEASDYRVSAWLLTFSIFLFLALATIKRVSELMDARRQQARTTARRAYETEDIAILMMMGVGASFVSVTVLALFVQSDSVATRYLRPEFLWIVVPLVLFWQCRLWLSTARGYMHDDPIVYAARDPVSWVAAIAILVVFVLARGFYSTAG
jgi:4-hydroxybenzoate polyprenyltransferase